MSKKVYSVRIPRYAKGIRLQRLRTGAGRNWWEMRWLDALVGKDRGGRLGRGRNYALSGQVTEIKINGSHVEAQVLGVRATPYVVTVDFRCPQGAARKRLIAELKDEPMRVARLLADDLPTEVETMFRRAGCDLFPGGKLKENVYDMTTNCSCPDYANPCKHAYAALLLLGEEVARRPLLLLELRGIRPEELYED